MNIDFNRICKLAGVSNGAAKRMLREGKDEDLKKEMYEEMEEEMHSEGDGEYMEEEDQHEEQDEMVEVDVSELMSEIRRAKRIMKENRVVKQRRAAKRKRLQEANLKRTIAQEVQNVLAEMEEHDSSWLYGNKKPRHSRRGYTNQGRAIPGIGFKRY